MLLGSSIMPGDSAKEERSTELTAGGYVVGRWRHPVRRIDRRAFLRRVGATSLGLSGIAALAACSDEANVPGKRASFKLARPDDPVELPLFEDNPPIEDGLEPERGVTLKIYNWEEYIYPKVVSAFAEQYGVEVEISSFANMDDALSSLREGGADYDIFFHRVDVVGRLVAAKMLQPLNHSYIPNMDQYVWPVYRNPFYDLGWRYTVPYTVYTTGIAWRVDRVDDDIAAMPNPYEIFWDRRYRERVHVFNDYREVVSMALLKNGITDLNTADTDDLRLAARDLAELAGNVGSLDIDGYSDLPSGEAWIHQAWSGDVLAAPYYFPKGGDPTVLRYWFPADGGGVVANDAMGILSTSKNPVLAHHFLNYLLDHPVALKNYSWNGYQPPQTKLDTRALIAQGYVPPYLDSAIVHRYEFNRSFMQLELSPAADRRWHRVYEEFESRV
jgi:spermidine/putrescine transport system substrate-binding protein